MSELGDFNLSTTLYTKFTTVNASGVPTTLGDSPTFGFYQDANVTLFTAGVTVTSDFNSTTGLNHLQLIVTTSATGIAAGSSYQLVIATGSVSGVSMKGYVVGEFSVLQRSPLRPTTAGRTLVVDAAGLATTSDFTTQLTESYRANGAAPTPAQALMELLAHHGEASISGTVKTIKKLDHATTAETFTLDSATTPSSVTRAT